MQWPLKPYPEDILPEKILATAFSGANERGRGCARIINLFRELFFLGIAIPDCLIKEIKQPRQPRLVKINGFIANAMYLFGKYDKTDPISILTIASHLFIADQYLYPKHVEGNIPLYKTEPPFKSSINAYNLRGMEFSKELLIACLEQDTFKTLSLFVPEPDGIVNILIDDKNGESPKLKRANKEMRKFLIYHGLRIDPVGTLDVLSFGMLFRAATIEKIEKQNWDLGLDGETDKILRTEGNKLVQTHRTDIK